MVLLRNFHTVSNFLILWKFITEHCREWICTFIWQTVSRRHIASRINPALHLYFSLTVFSGAKRASTYADAFLKFRFESAPGCFLAVNKFQSRYSKRGDSHVHTENDSLFSGSHFLTSLCAYVTEPTDLISHVMLLTTALTKNCTIHAPRYCKNTAHVVLRSPIASL